VRPFRAASGMLAIALALWWPCAALSQDPAAPAPAADAGPAVQYSADELEKLVGPIALYPDDLLAIILPSSTYPLDVVKAQRFLEKLKADPKLQPDPALPEAVRNLLNYPDVIKKMNDDLDWVEALGEAVVSQQAAVMDAIQAFRRKASTAGSLKTDDKQIIVQEKEVIKIVPADPEVVYVPQYQPSTVVVQSAPPVYYPTPYPSYYYPYPPGAAFATGVFFGAMTAWAFNWGGNNIENNVNINRTDNINVDRSNNKFQNSANRAREAGAQRPQNTGAGGGGRGQSWRSDKQPGQLASGRTSPRASARPGDSQFGGGRGDIGGRGDVGGRGDIGGRGDVGGRGDIGGRGDVGGRGDIGGGRGDIGGGRGDIGGGRGDAFGGIGSGSSAARASDRGASSRAGSLGGGGGGGRASSLGGGGGGGGGRASAGGGGRASSMGGGGGGRRGGGGGGRRR
jgi:hypothetical protein